MHSLVSDQNLPMEPWDFAAMFDYTIFQSGFIGFEVIPPKNQRGEINANTGAAETASKLGDKNNAPSMAFPKDHWCPEIQCVFLFLNDFWIIMLFIICPWESCMNFGHIHGRLAGGLSIPNANHVSCCCWSDTTIVSFKLSYVVNTFWQFVHIYI